MIGSTSSINAIDNVGQTASPVYLANGTPVTTSTTSSGLWSGSLLNPIDEDLTGARLGNIGLDDFEIGLLCPSGGTISEGHLHILVAPLMSPLR